MALVSLKQSANAYTAPMDSEYGYGTCLRLTDEQCKALGITSAPPAGTLFMITAQAVAKSVTEEMSHEGEGQPEVCMELQLTAMELAPEKSRSRGEIARAMYPDMAE